MERAQRMIFDIVGPSYFTSSHEGILDDCTRSCPVDAGPSSYCYGDGPYDYVESGLANRFFNIVHAADQSLWDGCTQSQLGVVAELVDGHISKRIYGRISQWANRILPSDHTLLGDYYSMKKLVKDLSLPIEKIHRLYSSRATAEHMTWHATHQTEEGSMCHPSDVDAWKHFDDHMLHELENNVAIILCNLVKIFPPTFFDSMEHLIFHLLYEASVGGPVQYSTLSRMCNPNEACLEEMMSARAAMMDFRASGATKRRWLSGLERYIIEMYNLTNCEVVTPYYESYLNKLYQHQHPAVPIIDRLVSTEFKDWFKLRVHPELNYTDQELLKCHYWGRSAEVTLVPTYFINEFNFSTEHHNTDKSTMNCGVCVKSSSYTNEENNFYGIIKEIIQLTYLLIPNLHIVLFKCRWVDLVRGMKVHPSYHLIDVNFKKLYQKDDPFILAQQAVQVYFTEYPSMKRDKVDWMAICKIKTWRVVNDFK
ncbi:UNVERIFIED_CONTAM: hypothetical protein Scaly_2641600 [Sesamum calycinum]|uniref:DUF4218 domain-containing protein n=1 Tax=Sesamum calycinum TaxID=2727403 RepID=A0AAW2JAE1_9LAMI